jgi:COMPASS component SPP1
MSRLADLLNPAPSSARGSPAVEALDTAGAQQSTRLPSLASPLEGLALAADQQASAPRHPNATQQYSSLDASARPDATTMATERETTVKSENGIPGELGQHETDVPMVDAVVKQEPTEAAACLGDEPKPKNEDDSVANIKTEPMQHDESSTVPQNTSILPTTEKSRPASKAAPKKTSTAKKAAPRKRKAEQASKDGTPASQRSGTPASNRASKSVAAKNAQPSPARSFADEEDDGEDGGVFCICRGPDDHTWMIGCDGECEDWFHGRCVNMKQEDADLVDKYICMRSF